METSLSLSSIRRGISWLLFGQALIGVRGIVTFMIFTQFLNLATYGVLSQLSAVAALVGMVGMLGLEDAMTRYLLTLPRDRVQAYATAVALAVLGQLTVIGGVCFAFGLEAMQDSWELQERERPEVLIIVALVVSVTMARIPGAVFKGMGNQRQFVGLTAMETVVLVAAVFFCMRSEASLTNAVWALVVGNACVTVIGYLWTVAVYRPCWPAWDLMRMFYAFGLPLAFNQVAFWILNFSDRLIIGGYRGNEEVGLYSAADNIGLFAALVFAPVREAIYPNLVQAWEKRDRSGVEKLFSLGLRFSLALCLPVLAAMAIFREAVVVHITSEAYRPAASYLPWLAFGILIDNLGLYRELLLRLAGRTRSIFLCKLTTSLLCLGLNLILVWWIGAWGAVATSLVAYSFQFWWISRCSTDITRSVPGGVPLSVGAPGEGFVDQPGSVRPW